MAASVKANKTVQEELHAMALWQSGSPYGPYQLQLCGNDTCGSAVVSKLARLCLLWRLTVWRCCSTCRTLLSGS